MSRVGDDAWSQPADEPACDDELRAMTDREETRAAMRRAMVRAAQQEKRQS